MRKTGYPIASSLVVAALAGPGLAFAEETFQTEVGAQFAKLKADGQLSKTAGLDATYYFDKLPVQPKDAPLDQVQFVERVGSVSANYAWQQTDLDNFQRQSDGSQYGARIDFRRPDIPFVFIANARAFDFGKFATSTSEFQSKVTSYELDAGGYVEKDTLLFLQWSKDKVRTNNSSIFSGSADTTQTLTTIGLSGQHLARLGGSDYVALIAGVAQIRRAGAEATEKNNEFSLAATYYPKKTIGLSLGVATNSGDNQSVEGQTYAAAAKVFFTPSLSVSLEYDKFYAKTPGYDFDAIALRAALRF